ncbi:hypothetical protein ElyMa_000616900 [Elysia marginata]|uniref:Uncharacterized protein n=1 Tax=Elysia marginata TaxID=1093978 RepID=A0AAV4G8Y5_9GAST|nr:hypothetical protein ElyMa_000616900 [Elysia marginata]
MFQFQAKFGLRPPTLYTEPAERGRSRHGCQCSGLAWLQTVDNRPTGSNCYNGPDCRSLAASGQRLIAAIGTVVRSTERKWVNWEKEGKGVGRRN